MRVAKHLQRVPEPATARDDGGTSTRRRVLLDAARTCFLKFGFGKTSLDDIAKQANVSRPLIYRTFKNKEDIFAAVFADTFAERYPAARAAAEAKGKKSERLLRVCEVLLVEPWEMIAGTPMLAEYYEACERLLPQEEARHAETKIDCAAMVLGDRALAEVFALAVEGLLLDLPAPTTFRRRLAVLVDRFV